MLLTKRDHHCTIFQTLSALMKVQPINYAIFETARSGSFQILHHFSVIKDNSSVFFQLKPHILWTKIAQRSKTFGLLSGWMKIYQIPYVICGTKSQFFIKLWITLQCHKTELFCIFSSKFYMLWTKGSDQSANFQTFNCLDKN